MDGGRWTVDGGRWTVDGGRWTVDGAEKVESLANQGSLQRHFCMQASK